MVHVQASASVVAAPKKRSKLEEVMERDQAFKKAKAERATNGAAAQPSGRSEMPWLHPGITVKVCGAVLLDVNMLQPCIGIISGASVVSSRQLAGRIRFPCHGFLGAVYGYSCITSSMLQKAGGQCECVASSSVDPSVLPSRIKSSELQNNTLETYHVACSRC